MALPLDFSNEKGGSQSLGGPLDKEKSPRGRSFRSFRPCFRVENPRKTRREDGRLLVQSNVLLTDMHDGRKKVFLATGAQELQLKTSVILGGCAIFGPLPFIFGPEC